MVPFVDDCYRSFATLVSFLLRVQRIENSLRKGISNPRHFGDGPDSGLADLLHRTKAAQERLLSGGANARDLVKNRTLL